MITPLHRGDWQHVSYLLISQMGTEAILINAGPSADLLIQEKGPRDLILKGIILLSGSVEEAARAGDLSARYSAPIWAHSDDLMDLQRLPNAGKDNHLCGVKSPRITKFLPDRGSLELSDWTIHVQRFCGPPLKGTLLRVDSWGFAGKLDEEQSMTQRLAFFSGTEVVYRTFGEAMRRD